MKPRDLYFHPQAWGASLPDPSAPNPDTTRLSVLIMLGGLAEILVLVGGSFTVISRRRQRDLALLAAVGATPRQLRHVLFAQAVLLGAIGSGVGCLLGYVAFRASTPLYTRVTDNEIWSYTLAWLPIQIFIIGSLLATVLAAGAVGVRVGRLPIVEALSRRPDSSGHQRTRRLRLCAIGALALGIALIAVRPIFTGTGTGFTVRDPGSVISVSAAALLTLGLLALTPTIFQRAGRVARALPLTLRYAARDSARNSGRAAGIAASILSVVTLSLIAAFALNSQVRSLERHRSLPPHAISISLNQSGMLPRVQLAHAQQTLAKLAGPGRLFVTYSLVASDESAPIVQLRRSQDDVTVADDDVLSFITKLTPTQRRLAANGGILVTNVHDVTDGEATVVIARPGAATTRVQLPAAVVERPSNASKHGLGAAWITPATAKRIGFSTAPIDGVYVAHRSITQSMIDQMRVVGLLVSSGDVALSRLAHAATVVLTIAGLIALLVAVAAVMLGNAESRADFGTLSAIGASPTARRKIAASCAAYATIVGALLGAVLASAVAPMAFHLKLARFGSDFPWEWLLIYLLLIPLGSAVAGWLLAPRRLQVVTRDD